MRNRPIILNLKDTIYDGNGDALGELYEILCKDLTLFALNCSSRLDSSALEDIVQEVFIWIADNRKKLINIDDLESYLYAAVRSNVAREEKKFKNNQLLKRKFLDSEKAISLNTNSPEQNLIEAEELTIRKKRIEEIMNNLPLAQKEVLFLRNYSNLSYLQISVIMDLSDQVVRNYSHRAIKKIRAEQAELRLTDSL